jgi:predicted nucleic acid-binding protein
MPDASFLDTGVVLGFCFRDDAHHYRCRQYLDDHDFAIYVSDHVVSEHLNRETTLAEEIADGIFDHIDRLRNSEFEGQLDSMDTSRIRQDLIGGHNTAGTTLHAFYRDEVPNFIHLDDIIGRLRDLARDIEGSAIENRETLFEQAEVWERDEEYADIDDELSAIPWDDRRICLDAHDVAVATGHLTELATTNPTDLVDDGYRELILEHTSIEDVVSLANRS